MENSNVSFEFGAQVSPSTSYNRLFNALSNVYSGDTCAPNLKQLLNLHESHYEGMITFINSICIILK